MDTAGRARRVMWTQVVISLVLGITLFFAYGPVHGLSAVYGGAMSLLVTLLLSRSVRRAEDVAQTDPKRGMTLLYVGAVQRFVVLVALFAIGLGLLKLKPLAVLAGFAATQFAQLINARAMTRDSEGERK